MTEIKKGLVVKILDTVTGKTHETDIGYTFHWWSEGNGSCDCNRVPSKEIEHELDSKYGDGFCYGCNRFLIIDIVSEGCELITNKNDEIKKMNNEYPLELLQKYLPNVYL